LGGAYAVERLVRRAGSAAGLTVCCATDGNHGRSVAWGAAMFGARAVIFIHATVSEGRRRAIEAYGADVIRTAGNYDDSVREAEATAAREGWQVVSDTSYPGYMDVPKDVMQGYETMAAEAFDRLDAPPTYLFLQTGVGGMAAAVAGLAKRRWGATRPTVVLADPVRAACWAESMRAGAPVAIAGDIDTMMAGLACGEVSLLAWEILKDHADAVVTVEDAAAAEMMRMLARPAAGDPPVVAGESAVAGLCALQSAMADADMRRALGLGAESRVLVFGTEGATDPDLYRQIVDPEAGSPRP
ncbi:MAG: diaminopropionate ammonia-lyase, partial [Alphaproteobacteria bacterium]